MTRGSQAEQAGARAAAGTENATPKMDRPLRRGLPRIAGGEPWPLTSQDFAVAADAPVKSTVLPSERSQITDAEPHTSTDATVAASMRREGKLDRTGRGRPLRRGLPRIVGGEPWPPAGFAPFEDAAASETDTPSRVGSAQTSAEVALMPMPAAQIVSRQTVIPARYAFTRPERRPEPKRVGPFTRVQWAGAFAVSALGLLFAAGMAVALVRWFLSTSWGTDFVSAYPGEYHLPESAPIGFPAWLGWQHFFNVFLMVLIIRSGGRVRTEKRPAAYWSPRWNGQRKISLTVWFHQSLDILWLLNGAVFVVLLFATGQWMRIVPTSWEVFPNAISAALQYVSLDWPTENGWVNYNSLQQLAYFATVFIAAPLAALTGVRMSGVWPKDAKRLNRIYPVEWARAVHFPVMLYFVVFIAIHVFLVFATGALRNLNHMYAAQGSADPNAYADNWAGFWWFAASLVLIAAAWVAARPLVLAPIARLFGNVSSK